VQKGVVPCENPDFHVSAVRGTVYCKTVSNPSVLSRMSGTCSVPERHVIDVKCVNSTGMLSNVHVTRGQGGACHMFEGKHRAPSEPANLACERRHGTADLPSIEEMNRMHGHGVVFPNYKCSPRGTCVWENDVRGERSSA
jgi:hypothetical protein